MRNPNVNTIALRRLADKLVGEGEYKDVGPVPEEKFDMGRWKCGTAACACGHAGSDEWFIGQGFHLTSGDDDAVIPRFRAWNFDKENYEELDSWRAVEKFFRIDEEAAANLFSWSRYIKTREQVAANIRQFVKLWEEAKAKEELDKLWRAYEF